jgi:methionine-gamma-lyase
MDKDDMRLETKATHVGQGPEPYTGSIVTPIYQTSTFVFPSVEEGAARFSGESDGFIYTRIGNPTLAALEKCVSALENGEKAIAFASGMSAISSVVIAMVSAGDHIVADKCVYGSVYTLFDEVLTRFGVEVDFVDCSEPEQVERAVKPNTKLIYFESPANPVIKLVDIEAMVQIAKKHGIMTMMDNTFMSPVFQRPIEWGADVVVHSATKYLGGHGDLIGGIAVGSKGFMDHVAATTQKDLGGVLGPFDAWLILRGIRTLHVRMERHEYNAMKVAEFLENHPGVERVYYPGFESHPQHELAKKQMTGFGGMIAVELKGGFQAGKTLMDSVRLCHLAVSLGETSTLVQHPASMTHSVMTPEARQAAGISDGLIRVSVGLEHVDDIIADLSQALEKATGF